MNRIIYRNKTLRLENYDYTQNGLYFITICTNNKEAYFGEIKDNILIANSAGYMIEKIWLELCDRFDFIKLHNYVVMPNHFHSIIEITDSTKSIHIGNTIGAFKSISTNEYIKGVHNHNWLPFNKRLWQKNYYEHIIRDEKSYLVISDYIKNNPLKWELDRFYINN
jgi:REP element-mobilizing transposase RayT